MAVAYVASGTAVEETDTTLTVSHTVGSGQSLFLMFELAGSGTVPNVTSVLWNGSEALTLIGSVSQSVLRNGYLYGIKNPTAATANVVATVDATPIIIAGSLHTYSGVDQTTPWGTAATGNNNNASPTVTVGSTTAGNKCICACISAEDYSSLTMSNGTKRNEQTTANAAVILADRDSQATSTQVNGTFGVGTIWTWVGVELFAAAAGTKAPPPRRRPTRFFWGR